MSTSFGDGARTSARLAARRGFRVHERRRPSQRAGAVGKVAGARAAVRRVPKGWGALSGGVKAVRVAGRGVSTVGARELCPHRAELRRLVSHLRYGGLSRGATVYGWRLCQDGGMCCRRQVADFKGRW